MKLQPQPAGALDPRSLDDRDRATVVARLRYVGRDDLADLYEHCATFYPSHDIAPGYGATLGFRPEPVIRSASLWMEG